MKLLFCNLVFCLFASPLIAPLSVFAKSKTPQGFGEIQVSKLSELSNREIAAEAKVAFDISLTQEAWNQCLPVDSIPFPKELSEETQARIFKSQELEDLTKCKPDDCAFEFLPLERKKLAQINEAEAAKEAYWQFYKDRKLMRTGMTQSNFSHLLRSRDEAFSICKSEEFNELIDKRPLRGFEFRLQVDDHDSRARPTTRLLQSYRFTNQRQKEICYGEVLIFADHYDLDRIELWSLKPGLITLQVRHRLDFLHSWLRRLRKPELRKALQERAESEMGELLGCLAKASSEP